MNSASLLSSHIDEFSEYMNRAGSTKSYNTLLGMRSKLKKHLKSEENENRVVSFDKIKIIEARMTELLSNGVTNKRRKEGTGTKRVLESEYKDNATNRKLERVGKKYQTVIYEEAEYEEIPVKPFRPTKSTKKRKRGTSITSPWILAMKQAKEELKAPAFVLARKEVSNPEDPKQVLGNKVYLRAKEILIQLKNPQ